MHANLRKSEKEINEEDEKATEERKMQRNKTKNVYIYEEKATKEMKE